MALVRAEMSGLCDHWIGQNVVMNAVVAIQVITTVHSAIETMVRGNTNAHLTANNVTDRRLMDGSVLNRAQDGRERRIEATIKPMRHHFGIGKNVGSSQNNVRRTMAWYAIMPHPVSRLHLGIVVQKGPNGIASHIGI